MSVRWKTIVNRLHPESGLKDPLNEVSNLLEPVIGDGLDEYDEYLDKRVLNGFLMTAEAEALDNHGREFGLERETNEEDNTYRQRILNFIDLKLTTQYCKNQGLMLWTKDKRESNIRDNLTSLNTYTNNMYACVPKTKEALDFVGDEIIYEYNLYLYKKGW